MTTPQKHTVGLPTALFFGACVVAALLAGEARAAGDESPPAKPNCPKGQVWDSTSKKCVMQTSQAASDADRTDYAYRLAKDGRYDEALALLNTLKNPHTAKALNTGVTPRENWAAPMKASVTTCNPWRWIPSTHKCANTWARPT